MNIPLTMGIFFMNRARWLRGNALNLYSGGHRFDLQSRQIWLWSYSHRGECRIGMSFPGSPSVPVPNCMCCLKEAACALSQPRATEVLHRPCLHLCDPKNFTCPRTEKVENGKAFYWKILIIATNLDKMLPESTSEHELCSFARNHPPSFCYISLYFNINNCNTYNSVTCKYEYF